MGVFIGNYDKGGHKVSLRLKYYPGSPQPREERENRGPALWVKPLFNTLNIMEMAGQNYGTLFDTDSLTVEFEVPEGVKSLKLRYLTTGHGGWGGGDEFNQKENRIFIDGSRYFRSLRRTDCGTWRKYNPASGNFWNGITSSDYSRSGWCPGSATVLFRAIGKPEPRAAHPESGHPAGCTRRRQLQRLVHLGPPDRRILTQAGDCFQPGKNCGPVGRHSGDSIHAVRISLTRTDSSVAFPSSFRAHPTLMTARLTVSPFSSLISPSKVMRAPVTILIRMTTTTS